jgi:hypothetical protein
MTTTTNESTTEATATETPAAGQTDEGAKPASKPTRPKPSMVPSRPPAPAQLPVHTSGSDRRRSGRPAGDQPSTKGAKATKSTATPTRPADPTHDPVASEERRSRTENWRERRVTKLGGPSKLGDTRYQIGQYEGRELKASEVAMLVTPVPDDATVSYIARLEILLRAVVLASRLVKPEGTDRKSSKHGRNGYGAERSPMTAAQWAASQAALALKERQAPLGKVNPTGPAHTARGAVVNGTGRPKGEKGK